MKFVLTYDGALPAAGNNSNRNKEKWDIRRSFAPQLRELWNIHPALKTLKSRSLLPKGGYWIVEGHHSLDHLQQSQAPTEDALDVCAPIIIGGRAFLPLIRESLAVTCGLKILFLRKEMPGKVFQGGDLDNRIKTLLDSLSVPQHANQVIEDRADAEPVYCLLEDDKLISGLSVETERLLSDGRATDDNFVRLVIDVDVRVTQARLHNSMLLG